MSIGGFVPVSFPRLGRELDAGFDAQVRRSEARMTIPRKSLILPKTRSSRWSDGLPILAPW